MSLKITQLTATNVKRLSAVSITPDGNLIIVGGENGAGKSSVLDSIMYALAGKSAMPDQPIRAGEKAGKIVVELDGDRKLIVERRLTASGGTVEIKQGDGSKVGSPQGLLDSLCGKIAFDPLDFTRQRPADQAKVLRNLVRLDFSELDSERKKLFDQRTEVNRQAKQLQAQMEAIQVPAGVPSQEVSVSALMEELKRRRQVNDRNRFARGELLGLRARRARDERDGDEIADQIRKLKAKLAEIASRIEAADKEIAEEEVKIAALVDADTAEIESQIQTADSTNQQVRQAKERGALWHQLGAAEKKARELTVAIDKIDYDKITQLSEAKWPVPGLGFGESGITLNGLPFEQASSAEQLRVSVAMGLALNPTLRVLLIRDGSLLDHKSLAIVAEMAANADAQLWIERVGEGAECSVIIEDGHVKA